jgi:hypothetical protein
MFHHDHWRLEQRTQWCCSVCGLRKPIGHFSTGALLRGKTICHDCLRNSHPGRKRPAAGELLDEHPGAPTCVPAPGESPPAID